MNVKRLGSLLGSISCGFLLALGLMLLVSNQAMAVNHEMEGVIRYVSTTGNDASNDCTVSGTPCRTVQHAIYMSQDGDEIRVAAGTYTGTMTTPGAYGVMTSTVVITKDISALLGGFSTDFASRDSNLNQTTLDAQGIKLSHVVLISETNTIVDGFTLTGARRACTGDCPGYWGGGLLIHGGAPTISHNRIQDNVSWGRGGGIRIISFANPIISENVIYSNTTDNSVDGLGGGIQLGAGTNAIIIGNEIISNVAEVEGGGIFIVWNTPATIISNTIAYNEVISPTAGRGGGIRVSGDMLTVNISHNDVYRNTSPGGGSGIDVDGPVILESNNIHGNISLGWGGAVQLGNSTQPITLSNNLIVDNYGTAINGISYSGFSDLSVFNNTIAGNMSMPASSGNGIEVGTYPITPTNPYTATIVNNIIIDNASCGITGYNGVHIDIDYNDVFSNGQDYCGLADPPSGEHNLSADPMFTDPTNGNYHLLPGSPAINAGDNAYAPAFDFAGTPRPQGLIVDMGAYEFIFTKLFLPLTLK